MKKDTPLKDKKPEKLFVRGLMRVALEGECGHTGKKSPGVDSSQFTTLIVGEECY